MVEEAGRSDEAGGAGGRRCVRIAMEIYIRGGLMGTGEAIGRGEQGHGSWRFFFKGSQTKTETEKERDRAKNMGLSDKG